MKYNSKTFTESLQAQGRIVFEAQELVRFLDISRKASIEILSRWMKARHVVSLTRGLYALIHPSEKENGVRPLHIIDELMRYRHCRYYVGLLSAADYWGAAEQKPMWLQVVVSHNLTLRKKQSLGIRIYTRKHEEVVGLVQGKTDAGPFILSGPALTALDVVTFENQCGGLDHVSQVVKRLVPLIRAQDLKMCAETYCPVTSLQRLGFLMERHGAKSTVLGVLQKKLERLRPPMVVLTPLGATVSTQNKRWNILINHQMEENDDL